ncbi:MAG: hydrolase family protein [Bacilli bacterium]|nr:hydrolase family protein [Bacilli bacterium]
MIKKLLAATSLLTIFTAVPAFASDTPPDKDSLVALGDSITFGYNLGINNDHPSKYAFPFVIGHDLKETNVKDLAVPGWTTIDLLNALKTDKFKEDISHAEIVTLDIGSNDFLQTYLTSKFYSDLLQGIDPTQDEPELIAAVNSSVSALDLNLATILSDIRSLTKAPIVLYDTYNPFKPGTASYGISNLLLPSANSSIKSISSAFANVHFADAYSAFLMIQNNTLNQAPALVRYDDNNDIHPTVFGQQVLAKLGETSLYN